jgi:hypothetical protein
LSSDYLGGCRFGDLTTCPHGNIRYSFRMSVKEQVLQAIQRLPNDTDFPDLTDEIALLAAVQEAERDIQDSRLISNDEMKSRIARWSTPHPTGRVAQTVRR